ncbi:phosphomannomutase [Xaviernesmea oryzae]|uniref:Phosphomannomutase n=1 Tax=Xaviernesmea oryzae TaxID=464029 RepID=A0A1Q9AV27_9HYPH|nr:phosphomannomutase [Xaviernesmea oryzae]OLP59305.1 phosphomannomutase [Xaviernesmea oryzae]
MKFGTSGLRGLVEDLEGQPAALYATAFARMLLGAGKIKAGDAILIGRDFRDSSPKIAAICAGALSRAGLRVVDCGTIPTPALALYGLECGCAALMITGSHIPADRNGIKFYRPDGEIDKADEQAIQAQAAALREAGGVDATAGDADEQAEAEAIRLFLARNKALLPAGALKGLKIGVYQHSTVARDLFVDLLDYYGAQVLPLGRSDVFIPVDTEAVSPGTVALMRDWTREFELHAVVSADGDGDRPLVADETGEPIRGDLLGLVAAEHLDAQVAVTPVTSNSGLEEQGLLRIRRTAVGSPFVIAGMAQAVAEGMGGVIGFEANGGTLTASDFIIDGTRLRALPTRDSMLPVLAILQLAAERRMPLSAVVRSYALPVALSDRLENFPLETSSALMAHLRGAQEGLASFLAPIGEIGRVSDIDGLRVRLKDGRIIHFRPSGNAPEMRCYVEARTESQAEALLSEGLGLIRDFAAKRS